MAKFWIGQRVRIVGTDWRGHGPSPVGREAVIVDRNVASPRSGRMYDWCLSCADYNYILADSHELEPILPDGLEAEDQIQRLFTPEPCEADV